MPILHRKIKLQNSPLLKLGIFILQFIFLVYLINKPCQNLKLLALERLKGPLEADDKNVLMILKSKFLNEPSTKKYNLSKNFLYKITKNDYNWPFINNFTKHLFAKETGKFFIEAGALDGEYLSNTLWLERDLNWTGLLIEPDPYNYEEVVNKNRKAWTSNTCISTEPYPKQTVFVTRRRRSDITIFNNWVFRGASHEIGYESNTSEIFLRMSTKFYSHVQCFPLESYLLSLNKTTIDFLSLDIQGSELDALKQFPFYKYTVRAMAIEHETNPYYDEGFVKYFTDKGFELIGCDGKPDYYFINKSHFRDIPIEKRIVCPLPPKNQT
ncbi:UNVERIFIED_CONTAM: hypothetical protein RMT77_001703 [Armadillidium vulgare]